VCNSLNHLSKSTLIACNFARFAHYANVVA
jgi:hypothetical protein